MKTLICLLSLTFLFLPAPAPAGEQADLARRLVGLVSSREGFDRSMDGTRETLDRHMESRSADGEEEKDRARIGEALEETRISFPFQEMNAYLAELYAETFTREELEALVAFFESPVGRRWVEVQPEIRARVTARVLREMMEP